MNNIVNKHTLTGGAFVAGMIFCVELSAQKFRLWQESRRREKKITRINKIFIEKSIQRFQNKIKQNSGGYNAA